MRFILTNYFDFRGLDAGIIGVIFAWIYWSISIKEWVKWAFENDFSVEKILSIGRKNLLLWNKSTINNALSRKKK
jgi:hypothetical protein